MSAVRRIIIVTAVHGPSAHFLPEAFKSLCEQELPEGWEWHWVIQEDGRGEVVSRHVPDDRRVTFAQGRAGGPGTARTMALAHADGEYVKVLDADDQLPAGALARDLAALEENPEIGWATSRVLDLL
ncbi:glycosyltransferase family 2 protein, partial [Streptomyces anulatus]